MKSILKKLISLFLALHMALLCFCSTVFGTDKKSKEQVNSISTISTTEALSSSHSELSESMVIPDIALEGANIQKNALTRSPHLENNLYTIAYTDTYGYCTMKIFSYPVKFVDTQGKIKDISLEIEHSSEGGFRSAESDIITRFPEKFTDGISLEYEDTKIDLIPVRYTFENLTTEEMSAEKANLSSDKKRVSYSFGNKTFLEYELTYTGFKEDIVVESYTGQTEYNFIIKTNGLTLVNRQGSYYIEDCEGNVKATIGDIIIFTADEMNNTLGSMTHKVLKANQIYSMTVHVDSNFLKDEKTVYPIRIDPTIEINYDNNGSGAIYDTTINNIDVVSSTSGSICLGKYAEDNSISRILMRFPAVDFTQYTPKQITSVFVSLRDLKPGTPETTVSCYRFNGNIWSESQSVSWTGVNGDSYTDLQSSHLVSYSSGISQPSAYWYDFDITALAKQWSSQIFDQSKGILFKASDTTESGTSHVYKIFGSYNRASYRPTLTVEYLYPDGSISLDNRILEIEVGQVENVSAVVENSDSVVTYTSSDTSIAEVNSYGDVTGIAEGTTIITATIIDNNGNEWFDECIVYVYDFDFASGEYYVFSWDDEHFLSYDDNADNARLKTNVYEENMYQVWTITHLRDRIYYFTIQSSNIPTGACLLTAYEDTIGLVEGSIPNDNQLWKLTYKPSTNTYMFYNIGVNEYMCSNEDELTWGTGNIRWYIIESDEFITVTDFDLSFPDWVENDTTTSNQNYSISPLNSTLAQPCNFNWESSDENVLTIDKDGNIVTNSENDGYAVITVTHKSTGIVRKAIVIVDQLIPNGIYNIMNIGSQKYMDIEGPSFANGAFIQQWGYHDGNQAKWSMNYIGNGYYEVYSLYSSKKIASQSTIVDSAIIQTDESSDLGVWKVYITSEGNYKFEVKNTTNMVLSLPFFTIEDGINLTLKSFTDDEDYSDEWLLQQEYDASLISIYSKANIIDFFNNATDALMLMGYTNIYEKELSIGHNFLLNRMSHSKISVVVTHGNRDLIVTSHKYLTTNYLNNLDTSTLSNSELVLYAACQAGYGRENYNNIVNATRNLGVNTVIGFEVDVNCLEFDAWCKFFFQYLAEGYTIQNACYNAAEDVRMTGKYDEMTVACFYISGDENAVLLP